MESDVKALVASSQKLSASSPLMAPVYPEPMRYEILASTHYNTALRLGRDVCQSYAGDLAELKRKDPSFKMASEHLTTTRGRKVCRYEFKLINSSLSQKYIVSTF